MDVIGIIIAMTIAIIIFTGLNDYNKRGGVK